MSLASVAELETRLQKTLVSVQAQLALDVASALVDDEAGFPLLEATVVTRHPPSGTRFIHVGQRTTAVSLVKTESGSPPTMTTVPAAAWRFNVDERELERIDGLSWVSSYPVIITRVRGWAAGTAPWTIKGVVLNAAARIINTSGGGVQAEQLADHQITYGDYTARGGGLVLTDEEVDIVLRAVGRRTPAVA